MLGTQISAEQCYIRDFCGAPSHISSWKDWGQKLNLLELRYTCLGGKNAVRSYASALNFEETCNMQNKRAQQQHRSAPCKIKEYSLVYPLQSKHGLHIQCFIRMSGKHVQKLELYEPC